MSVAFAAQRAVSCTHFMTFFARMDCVDTTPTQESALKQLLEPLFNGVDVVGDENDPTRLYVKILHIKMASGNTILHITTIYVPEEQRNRGICTVHQTNRMNNLSG